MISEKCFKECVACLFKTFRSIENDFLKGSKDERNSALKLWHSALSSRLSDDQLRSGVHRMVLEVENLYPGTNWIAILCNYCKPKVAETPSDVCQMIMDVLSRVSFVYPSVETQKAVEDLKKKSPLAFAVAEKMGWKEMALADNSLVLRAQIRMCAESEIKRANEDGLIRISFNEVKEIEQSDMAA